MFLCYVTLMVVVKGSVMVGVVVLSRRFSINPDNVATPIAASLGDLTTISLLAALARGFYYLVDTSSCADASCSEWFASFVHFLQGFFSYVQAICPVWGWGLPLPPCPFTSSSFPLFTFPFLSLALPIFFFCPSIPFLPEKSHSVCRPEVVGGDQTWV